SIFVLCTAFLQSAGDVIAISLAGLIGMYGAQPVTGIIEQQAGEQMDIARDLRTTLSRRLVYQPGLHCLKGGIVDDRLMLAFVQAIPVSDFAHVNRVGEHVVELAFANAFSLLPASLPRIGMQQ